MSLREKIEKCLKLKPLPNIEKDTEHFAVDVSEFDLAPIDTPEIKQVIEDSYVAIDTLETMKKEAWIQTHTGKKFFPLAPREEDICIEDIAHALSMQCRFTGHSNSFYSVAQHSVLVSYICDKQYSFYGLMHDQTEAYLGDISRPLKRTATFHSYREHEKNLHKIMCIKFGLPAEEPADVKWADTKLLATEARDLLGQLHPDWRSPTSPLPFRIVPLPPKEAKELFLARFMELNEKI